MKSFWGHSRRDDWADISPMCLEADARHDNDNAAMAMELDMRLAIAAMRLVGWMTQLQPTTGVCCWKLSRFKASGQLAPRRLLASKRKKNYNKGMG